MGVKGRFGQVLSIRWASREELFTAGVDEVVWGGRNASGDRVEEGSVALYQGREIWLPFWCTPKSITVVIGRTQPNDTRVEDHYQGRMNIA